MNNRKILILLEMLVITIFAATIPFLIISFDKGMLPDYIIYILVAGVIIELLLVILVRTLSIRKNSTIGKLHDLIRYKQKRQEIEQEISLLTSELMHSDISEYVDVNRLIFDGQYKHIRFGDLNYDNFLNQFGIQKEKIIVKKGSAVFLTPFNNQGEELYRTCQNILSKLNIFLQKTDNLVDKDDILMNIISLIVQSEIIVVNIDGRNPNVYYELGIAHALGKPTILLSKTDFLHEDIGFDIRQKRIIMYQDNDDLEKQLLYHINRLKDKL